LAIATTQCSDFGTGDSPALIRGGGGYLEGALMPLASHIQLPERYRVTRHIASGGMASVWEVEDLLLERVVAVKVLGAQYAADRGARARFAREARTAARVCDHPHIATIYDIGEHGEDAFIVMELFSGGTVADHLRAAAADGARVPRETALRWLREAAGGLDYAHAAGIVHRDVKPANLLLDAQERLAVGDFGIARLADDTHMTQTGQLLGTAAYLSPEQALGRPASAASDRYALAVVAYELLTGTRPFAGGPPPAQLRQHAEAKPERASIAEPALPRAIDAVLARGLAKEPQERPRTAAELVGEINRALRDREPIERTRPLAPVVPLAPAAPAAEPEPARGRPRQPPPAAPAGTPPRPPPAAVPGAAAPGRPPRISPLVPIGVAAAVAGAVLAIVLAGGGDGERRAASSSTTPRTATQAARARAQARTPPPVQAAQAEQPAETATAPATGGSDSSSSKDPSALNDEGHALSQKGDYEAAVPLLRASVDGYRNAGRTKEIGYAYALFNLAVALSHSGDAAGAIDLLRERLRYPDQRPKVRQELEDARAQLEGTGTTTQP
jgi:tetratricopeptide (TPR) repeat protein